MLLYDSPVSGNCYKVRLLLAHLGIAYERRELSVVDRSDRPEVLGGLNPALRVPTLDPRRRPAARRVERDPLVLRRGHAARPGGSLRAREGAAVAVLRAVRPRAHDRGRAVLGGVLGVAAAGRPRSRRDARPATARSTRWSGVLAGAPFLVADRFTIADIALYAYTHVADEGGFELDRYPAIGAWLDRVAASPGTS